MAGDYEQREIDDMERETLREALKNRPLTEEEKRLLREIAENHKKHGPIKWGGDGYTRN